MVTRSSRTGQGVLVHILNVSGTQIREVLPGLIVVRDLVCGLYPSATQGKLQGFVFIRKPHYKKTRVSTKIKIVNQVTGSRPSYKNKMPFNIVFDFENSIILRIQFYTAKIRRLSFVHRN